MKYLILGAGGMAGHMITIYLLEQGQEVEGIARRNLPFCKTHEIDATNFEKLKEIIIENQYDVIVNCIGLLNSTAEEHIDQAILVNSYLPHYLVRITSGLKTKVIQMSTDCVFSGKKGNYKEADFPDGETYYDRTKALGEIIDNKNLTFRNSIIGPDINENGIGLFNWFAKQKSPVYGYTKSIWTGVTTLTLAEAIYKASLQNLNGLYNLVNNEVINKFELLELFNKYSNKNLSISKTDGINHDKSLINTRNDFNFVVPDYETMVKEMFKWIEMHKSLYPHYYR